MDLILKYSGTTIYEEIKLVNADFVPRKGDKVLFSPLGIYMNVKEIVVDYMQFDDKSEAQVTVYLEHKKYA